MCSINSRSLMMASSCKGKHFSENGTIACGNFAFWWSDSW